VSNDIGVIAERAASEILAQGTDATKIKVMKTDNFLFLNVHLGRDKREMRAFPLDYSKLTSPQVLAYEGKHAEAKYDIDRDGQSKEQLAALEENLKDYETERKRARKEESDWEEGGAPIRESTQDGIPYKRWC
jgi:hypothetical protein